VTPPRVLCYAPYNRWALHGRWEMTILQALKLRGAEVEYVLCDGLYTDCDQFWGAVAPRPQNACSMCQMQVVNLVHQMGMDFHWLGRYLQTDEGREAKRWSDALADDELLTASYGEWHIAQWVRTSVQSHFRANEIDVSRPAVAKVMRSYLASGLVACFALDRLLDEQAPDVFLLFNGRQSSTRVALELAKSKGVRTVVHERGPRNETLRMVENETCASLEPIRQFWADWGDVPLTAEELEQTASFMAGREHGRDLSWTQFTSTVQPLDEVRAALRLRADRPVWALFTSSDDEVSGEADWASPFPTQRDWVARTIEYARRNPQIDLVIRVHPNTGSKRSTGANRKQLQEMRALAENLPPNVRMVDPEDEISSYSLMDIAAVGLVWVSTVGLEMACKGKSVVVAAGNQVHGTSFVTTVVDTDAYEDTLDPLLGLAADAVSADVRRLALRFAYGAFFRIGIDFPLVRMTTPRDSELAYASLDALQPGRDAGLDRCARIVLDGEPVYLPPTDADRARSTVAEDAFLDGFGKRRTVALAFADELIADIALLEAWANAFDGRDDVTLLIHTPEAHTARLVDAVTSADLDREDGPDLVALEADAATMASVDAIFSRVARDELAAAAPRYDDASLAELAGAR
jgi:hypothetical protein